MSLADKLQAAEPESTEKAEKYNVVLPDFYGPMDLLLSLIEQEDLEITEISLAHVTDQYLAYINSLQKITPDALTDFLVVAAKLILIKSQVLLPKPPPSVISEEEEDSTDDLVQQLKDYKRFKQLAAELNNVQETGLRSFVRVAPAPKIEPKLNIGALSVDDLLNAVRRALAVKPKAPEVGSVVSREVITIGKKINNIRTKLSARDKLSFNELLTEANTRVEVIVTLLAVLELIKRRIIDVDQPESFGDINIVKKENSTLSDADWQALSELEDIS